MSKSVIENDTEENKEKSLIVDKSLFDQNLMNTTVGKMKSKSNSRS